MVEATAALYLHLVRRDAPRSLFSRQMAEKSERAPGCTRALIFNLNVFLTFTIARSFLLYGRLKQMCRVSRLRNHRKCHRFCLNFNCAPVPRVRSSVATIFPCLPSGSVNRTTTQFYYSFSSLSLHVCFHENKAEDKLIVASPQDVHARGGQICCHFQSSCISRLSSLGSNSVLQVELSFSSF